MVEGSSMLIDLMKKHKITSDPCQVRFAVGSKVAEGSFLPGSGKAV